MDGGLPQPKVTDIVQSKSDYDGNNIMLQNDSLQVNNRRTAEVKIIIKGN